MNVTRAALDVRQERVLLRLVEAVHFVDEQDRRAARLRERRLGARDRVADVLDAGQHGRQRDELRVERVGHQPRERGLADARRSPQDHRMQLAGRERDGQRLARREQVPLPDDVGDRARPQPLGERRGGRGLRAVRRDRSRAGRVRRIDGAHGAIA